MFTIGSFALRHAKVKESRYLPLERVELVDGDSFVVRNRYDATSNTHKRNLIELDAQYGKYLWDELIQLELRIKLNQECLEDPTLFGHILGIGLVKRSVKEGEVSPELTPWKTIEIGGMHLNPLNDSRLVQIEKALTNLESEHEFVMQAIDSLG